MSQPSYPGIDRFAVPARFHETVAEVSDSLVDVRGTRQFLGRRWRLIGITALLCILVAGAALSLIPKTYSATAVLIVDPRQQKVTPTETVLGGIGADAAAVESQVEVLESSTLVKRVIERLGLDRSGELVDPSIFDRVGSSLRRFIGLAPTVNPADLRERVVVRFADRLRVRRRGLTYVLEVTYQSSNAELAARVSNTLVAEYLAEQKALKLQASTGAAEMLSGRLDELRARARNAEQAVSAFKRQNDIVDLGGGVTLLDREIAEQSQLLASLRARNTEAAARYAQAKQAMASANGGATLAESLQSQVITNLRNQYAQIAATLADLQNNLGARHPSVSAAAAQLRNVGAEIQAEIGRLAIGLRNESESTRARERVLTANLDKLKKQAGEIGQARVRLSELEREAQASKVVLEQYLLRFKETSEQQNIQSADSRVLSPAATPLKASSPQTSLLLGLSLIGGLVAGLGIAALVEALEPGLRTARSVEEGLGVPMIGLLPRFAPGRSGDGNGMLLGDSPSLEAFENAIRALALPLHIDGDAPAGGVLLVSSAVDGEGKSTVAEHLSRALARQGRNVLLVDLDARNPRLTHARQAINSPGLLDALDRSFDPGAFVHRGGSIDAVSFLPVGISRGDAEASVLFFSPGLGRAISDLRRRFDVIVLDGPPLLDGIEARLLIPHADRAALVVEWARTDPDSVRAAVKLFRNAPGTLAGIVFNKVEMDTYKQYASA